MTDQSFEIIQTKWKEIIDLPPQRLGWLTPAYHNMVKPLKVMPWPVFIVVSLVVVGSICIVLGTAIVKLVSILQRGI